jgi:hypothetical protein
LNLEPDSAVANHRPLILGPQYRLVLVPLNSGGAGTLANAARSGRMFHLKGLLASRSLLLPKTQYIAA